MRDARLFTDYYGLRSLTIPFIAGVHEHFLAGIAPDDAGMIEFGEYRGGLLDYSGKFGGVSLDPNAIANIRANPWLDFTRDEHADNPWTGYIEYRCKTPAERHTALQEVCDWYNAEVKQPRKERDRVATAAVLQRKIVSIHPFRVGINGRISRALMCWSLRNDNQPASAPANFNDDILKSEQQWIDAVRLGCLRYEETEARATMTCDPAEALELTQERLTYFKHRSEFKDFVIPVPGRQHDLKDCAEFLGRISFITHIGQHQSAPNNIIAHSQ